MREKIPALRKRDPGIHKNFDVRSFYESAEGSGPHTLRDEGKNVNFRHIHRNSISEFEISFGDSRLVSVFA
jgi:hypothetical protein